MREIEAPPAKPGFKIVYFQEDIAELCIRSYLKAMYVPEDQVDGEHMERDLQDGAFEEAMWEGGFLGATDGNLPDALARDLGKIEVLGTDLLEALKDAQRGEWGAEI